MQTVTYTITDELGIHARPAGQLVKLLQGFTSDVQIACKGKKVNGKGIMALMSLAVKKNDEVTFEIEGADEETAKTEIETFMKENL